MQCSCLHCDDLPYKMWPCCFSVPVCAEQVSEILQQVFELQAQAGQSITEQIVKAAVIGDLPTIQELFAAATTPISVDDAVSGHTALHAACQHGHLDVVEFLLSKFASTENEVSENLPHMIELDFKSVIAVIL